MGVLLVRLRGAMPPSAPHRALLAWRVFAMMLYAAAKLPAGGEQVQDSPAPLTLSNVLADMQVLEESRALIQLSPGTQDQLFR